MSDLLTSMAERVQRLEAQTTRLRRDNARIKVFAGIVAVALAGTVALGATAVNKSATPLAIADGNGTTRVRIDAAGVHLYDVNGKQRAKLGFTERAQPSFDILDSGGTTRESMYLTADSRPVFTQFDGNGNPRAWYFLEKAGYGVMDLTSKDKTDRVYISGDESGSHIAIGTGGTTNRAYLGISSEGGTILRLRGSNGNERAYLGETTEGGTQLLLDYASGKDNFILQGGDTPFLATYDPDGTTRNYLGFYSNGSQGIYFNNASGTTTWQSP